MSFNHRLLFSVNEDYEYSYNTFNELLLVDFIILPKKTGKNYKINLMKYRRYARKERKRLEYKSSKFIKRKRKRKEQRLIKDSSKIIVRNRFFRYISC